MANPPYNFDITNPADDAAEAVYPANERAFRDNVASYLNKEHDSASGHHAFPAITTASRDAITNWPNGAMILNTTSGVLQLNVGTTLAPSWYDIGPPSLELHHSCLFANITFAIPAVNIVCTLIGAGGGGAGGVTNPSLPLGGAGGGSGAIVVYPLYGLTVGNTLTLTVGTAGTGGAAGGAAGTNGGDTIIASGSQAITSATAGGGKGGLVSVSPGPNGGGLAGAPTGGIVGQSINLFGQVGGTSFSTASFGIPGRGGKTGGTLGTAGDGGDGGWSTISESVGGANGVVGMIYIWWLA